MRLKNLVILVVAGVVLYFGYRWIFSPGGDASQGMGAAPVSVAGAITKNANEWSEFSGRLEAVDRAEVRPRVSGQIDKVHFQDGEFVGKDQSLFTIDPKPYQAELQRARGALSAAQSSVVNSRKEYERALKLIETKTISLSEKERRENELRIAEGQVKSAEGALKVAELNLEYTQVLAPISGKASRAEITEGNIVNAGPGAPLLTTIVSMSPLYVSFDMDEQTFLSSIKGATGEELSNVPVEVGLADEQGTPHQATIDSFDNQLNIATGSIRVRAVVNNDDGSLLPGLFARVRIGSPQAQQSVLINERAVGTDQDKKYVFVVGKDSTAEYREITLGSVVDGLRIIKAGLKGDEKIVVNGLMRVRPGVPIQPQEVDMRTLKSLTENADAAAPAKKPVE